MRLGLAKDEAGAQKVLLVIFIVACVGMAFTLFSSGSKPKPPVPSIDGTFSR